MMNFWEFLWISIGYVESEASIDEFWWKIELVRVWWWWILMKFLMNFNNVLQFCWAFDLTAKREKTLICFFVIWWVGQIWLELWWLDPFIAWHVYLIANGLLPCVPGLEKFGLAEFLALGASLQFLEFWDLSAIIETKGLDCKIN